jgi:hypothetical protein
MVKTKSSPLNRRLIAQMGTIVPAIVFVMATYGYIHHEIVRDGPVIAFLYGITFLTFLQGIWALLQLSRLSRGEHPTAFLVMFLYQKVATAVLIAGIELGLLGIIQLSEAVFAALFMSFVVSHIIFNNILFWGRKRRWHNIPADPIPFRPLIRRLKKR